jgi:amino acid transporter
MVANPQAMLRRRAGMMRAASMRSPNATMRAHFAAREKLLQNASKLAGAGEYRVARAFEEAGMRGTTTPLYDIGIPMADALGDLGALGFSLKKVVKKAKKSVGKTVVGKIVSATAKVAVAPVTQSVRFAQDVKKKGFKKAIKAAPSRMFVDPIRDTTKAATSAMKLVAGKNTLVGKLATKSDKGLDKLQTWTQKHPLQTIAGAAVAVGAVFAAPAIAAGAASAASALGPAAGAAGAAALKKLAPMAAGAMLKSVTGAGANPQVPGAIADGYDAAMDAAVDALQRPASEQTIEVGSNPAQQEMVNAQQALLTAQGGAPTIDPATGKPVDKAGFLTGYGAPLLVIGGVAAVGAVLLFLGKSGGIEAASAVAMSGIHPKRKRARRSRKGSRRRRSRR